ncbi:DNA (cytosine-5)-methyltransferase CMT3-like [Iris pallida]|uniref:Cytosine-specific methyltransferase n=1 Tax=Iris pallida TaxID=29817 RepID=A0AAX6EP65_IRIPA|nr:DNA (cytosine-5)-methyltransferase CMT3-like [Iris pallida]
MSSPGEDGSSIRRSKRRAAEIATAAITGSPQEPKEDPIERKRARSVQKKKKTEAPKKSEPPPKAEADPSEIVASDDGLEAGEEEDEQAGETHVLERLSTSVSPMKKRIVAKRKTDAEEDDSCFLGDPVPEEEAKLRWPKRYEKDSAKRVSITNNGKDDDDDVKAKRHYLQARVDRCTYNLYEDAYVKAGEGEDNYICRIVEFFEGCDGQLHFSAQWFYRAQDTAIKNASSFDDGKPDHFHDDRRVFLSDVKDDNPLNCLVSKVHIVRVTPNLDLSSKRESIPPCDLYFDMSYSVSYSTFANMPVEEAETGKLAPKSDIASGSSTSGQRNQLLLLDLYSGCGAMSTGLCLGANLSGVNLQTRWAVDFNPHACESLKFNHPETEVRNELAQDFLAVLHEWERLCQKFGFGNENVLPEEDSSDDDEGPDEGSTVSSGEFEVGKIIDMCYGETSGVKKVGLKFKVRWKGYGPNDDTWEPIEGLGKCEERIRDFVRRGYNKKILPLPGTVDVICGGPPCQGISGFNRFRNYEAPLQDEKNKQMVVYMEIIEFLKPRFVLMENVVDILKFAKGYLGRYALSRLVAMNYQSRLGIMAAGSYGLPQFRMRVFLWGARPTEKLPQFPLPTHDVVIRGGGPVEFESSVVAYEENQPRQLKKELLLYDAISDLPPVANDESRDEMDYLAAPETDFQKYIRLSREELMNLSPTGEMLSQKRKLLDHRPLRLNDDDYQRVCYIPKKKGANFRCLPGVTVGAENKVDWDPNVERVLLPSGKPLVPNYAMSFINGKSSKPFGRLWWDETVPTVVTRAEPHNQVILHPEQDRVLSIRENARLQGFPDFYKFFGPLKERYMQIGNAVAVPVSRALGYALGQAVQRKGDDKHVFILPPDFPNRTIQSEIID